MNRRGSIFLSVIFAGALLIFAMLMLNFLITQITEVRDADHLNCSSSTISDGTKVLCLVTDTTIPAYFLTAVLLVGGLLIGKKVL